MKNTLLKIKQARYQIAQAVQDSKESSEEESKSINPDDLFAKAHSKVAAKLKETLASPETYRAVESYTAPFLSQPIGTFLEQNKEKIPLYLQDQSLLLKDIENEIPLFKYVGHIDNALTAIFIGHSIISLIITIGTWGAASGATVPVELAKWTARKTISQFLKVEGKNILKKIISKEVLKRIGKSVAVGTSKYFLQAAGTKVALIAVMDTLSSVVTDVTLVAVKNLLIEKGVSELGLPKDLVMSLIKPETSTEAFKRILGNATGKITEDFKEQFTTQEGWKDLTTNAAMLKVWKMLGTKSLSMKLYQRNKVLDFVKDPKNNDPKKFSLNFQTLTNQLQEAKDKALGTTPSTKEDLNTKELLEKSTIPKTLYPSYVELLSEHTKSLTDLSSKKEKAQALIHSADLTISAIEDSLYELVMIDFVRENQAYFLKNKSMLNNFIAKITDVNNMSLEDLLQRSETNSAEQAMQDLYRQKLVEINSLLEKVGLTSNVDKINSLRVYFMDKLNLKQYKNKLQKEVFGK